MLTPADIWLFLGLNENQVKILHTLEGMAKNEAQISRHTKLPKTTVAYALKNLYARKFLRRIIRENGRSAWKSELPRILRYFKNYPIQSALASHQSPHLSQ